MSGTYGTFDQMSFADLLNATSSLESEDGASHSDKQDGPTIGQRGRVPAHASLSARQAKEMGLMTSGTYGQPSSGLFGSVSPARSLVNRLRVKTDLLGSTLFGLTWKVRVTPLGRQIFALRASVRRTSGNGFGSVPTPMAGTPAQNGNSAAGNNDYSRVVVEQFHSVPTPKSQNKNEPGEHGQGGKDLQTTIAQQFSPVATPISMDASELGQSKSTSKDRKTYSVGHMPLSGQVLQFQPLATPSASDDRQYSEESMAQFLENGNVGGHGMDMNSHAQMFPPDSQADSGQTQDGNSAETESTDPGKEKLNAQYSRFLMGYPPIWCIAARLATRSLAERKKGERKG